MRKIFFLAAVSLLVFTTAFSQKSKLHTPAEILKIGTDSKLVYEVSSFSEEELKELKSDTLILSGIMTIHQDEKNTKRLLACTDLFDKEYSDIFHKAEERFRNGDIEKARNLYDELIKVYPNNSLLYTFMGQTYKMEDDIVKAKGYLYKAIELNPYDYMAHWFLGSILFKNGDRKKGLEEVKCAHMLNRNNGRILNQILEMLEEIDKEYDNWSFNVPISIQKDDEEKIQLKYNQENPMFLMYAMAKAIWKYEPGYKEDMLENNEEKPEELIEEEECIALMLMASDNIAKNDSISNEHQKPLFIEKCESALNKKMFLEYVIYEKVLRDHPLFAYNLNEKFLKRLLDYFYEYHVK